MPTSNDNFVNVFTSGFRSVYRVPSARVMHVPDVSPHFYVACTKFDCCSPQSSCPRGDACKFVHADLRGINEQLIHVNFAWRSLDHVTYPCMLGGRQLSVAAPNSVDATDAMDSSFVLQTQALEGANKLSHCAHYYFNRVCLLGPKCKFVHAVYLDPEAQPGQRAPPPSMIGRERQLSKKQKLASSSRGDTADLPARQSAELHFAASVAIDRPVRKPNVLVNVIVMPMRKWRHDPYSLDGPKTLNRGTPM